MYRHLPVLTRHLEDAFYRAALANFSVEIFIAGGFSDSLYKDLQTVAKDEATHVKFLTDAITAAGGAPVAECTYNFPVMDVKTFVSLASVLEGMLPKFFIALLICFYNVQPHYEEVKLISFQALVPLPTSAPLPAFRAPISSPSRPPS